MIGEISASQVRLVSDGHRSAVVPGLLNARPMRATLAGRNVELILFRWRLPRGLVAIIALFVLLLAPFISLVIALSATQSLSGGSGLAAWIAGVIVGAAIVCVVWKDTVPRLSDHLLVWERSEVGSPVSGTCSYCAVTVPQAVITPLSRVSDRQLERIVGRGTLTKNSTRLCGAVSLRFSYWSGVKCSDGRLRDPAAKQQERYPEKRNAWCLSLLIDDGNRAGIFSLSINASLKKMLNAKSVADIAEFFGVVADDIPVERDLVVCSISASDRGQIGALRAKPRD